MALSHALIIGTPWIFRQDVKQTLKRLGLAIVGEGDTFGEAWIGKPNAVRPTLILVILGSRQSEAALAAAREAKQAFEGAKLAFLSEAASAADVSAAIETGADALLSSGLSSRMLGHSLRLVLLGQKLFPALPSHGPGGDRMGAALRETLDAGFIDAEPSAAEALAPLPPLPPPPSPGLPEPPCPAIPPPVATSHVIRLEDHVFPVRPQFSAVSLVWDNTRPPIASAGRSAIPSNREWEILRCLCSGNSNKAIACELGIAETTVKVHVKSLLRKLAVSNRTQAAIWALNHGHDARSDARARLASAHLHGT